MNKIVTIVFAVVLASLGTFIMIQYILDAVDECEEYLATTTTTTTTTTVAPETAEPTDDTEADQPPDEALTWEEEMQKCLGLDTPAEHHGSSSEVVEGMTEAGYSNGQLPDSALMTVSTHGSYRCRVAVIDGAADAWLALVAAAQADGVDIEGGWCYRTLAEQESAYNGRRCYIPGNCDGNPYPPTAVPGTSNHGWGLAVDAWNAFNTVLSCNDSEFAWMQENAPSFGWFHPPWAACGQGSQEPWHWEFSGIVQTIAEEISDNPDTETE